MQKSLRNKISTLILLLCCGLIGGQDQKWKSAMEGILEGGLSQRNILDVQFMTNGPLGKDWIYGKWLDSDSIVRYAGYREGGKWVPLPITGNYGGGAATDIVQYGDTMYIGGTFTGPVLDGDSLSLPWVSIIKYFNDSLWYSSAEIYFLQDLAVNGDSLLVNSDGYFGPNDTLGGYMLSTDAGKSFQSAFDMNGPDGKYSWGGPRHQLKIKGGSLYVLYEGEGQFDGVVEWDGTAWHGRGQGFYGFSWLYDFEFYKDQIYLGGTFSKTEDPRNPGNGIVRFNGHNWEEVGGGINALPGGIIPGGVSDLFTYDDLLFAQASTQQFGDAGIPALAAWNDQQWCGTPTHYTHSTPVNFGMINDTLYSVVKNLSSTANGQPLSYINYFDGDYVNGPNAICSTLGLGEEEVITGKPSFEIFPVPAKSEVQVALPSGTIQHLKVYDLSGRCVLKLHPETETSETAVDVSGLVPGVYLLEVNGEYNGRFVKE